MSLLAADGRAGEIVITSTTDTVNGNVSTVSALLAEPGPDGISIREAVEATRHSAGPHAIRFSPALHGATIALTAPLQIRADGTDLIGDLASDGRPAITLDGNAISTELCCRALIFVLSSSCRISRLRFTGVSNHAIEVRAGPWPHEPSGSADIHDVTIDENVFDGSIGSGLPSAIRVWSSGSSTDITIERISIVRNVIQNYTDIGVIVNASGSRARLRDLVIDENQFSRTPFPIEVAFSLGGLDGRIERTRIRANRVDGSTVGLLIGTLSAAGATTTRNQMEDTTIVRNEFIGVLDTIDVIGGFSPDGSGTAIGNVVTGVEIANNLVIGGRGITILGGSGSGGTRNRVEHVRIANNTISTGPLPPITVVANHDGGSENTLADVTVRNTVAVRFDGGPSSDISGDLRAGDVFNTLTTDGTFAGANGNLAGDPEFEAGSQHLSAISPAIDRGTPIDAPRTDTKCRARVGEPDIGAFEFGATAVSRLTVVRHGLGAVSRAPEGTECGGATAYPPDTTVILTPLPSPGKRFAGWDGAEDCADGVVTMRNDVACVASFVTDFRRRRSVRSGQ